MEKNIRIEMTKDNEVVISCGEKQLKIKDMISAKEIYELLNYKNGDIYTVSEIDENQKVLIPIKEMFENIKNEINEINTQEHEIEKALGDVQLEEK
jgi:hypothetical protein